MKDNQAKYPQLRFKGFTNPWEQRKLGEIVAIKITNGLMNRPGGNLLAVKDINVVNMYTPDHIHVEDLEYFNATDKDLSRCDVTRGDVFVTRSSLKAEGIAEPNVLLENGRFVFDDHLMRLKPRPEINPYFLKELLSSTSVKKQFIAKAKTATMTTIGQQDISTSDARFPSSTEQKLIAELLQKIDSTIALHQRKLSKLKELKQGYLQKLFPKNGSKFPQLRFAGFADAWEQRKLGELGNVTTGKAFSSNEFDQKGEYLVITNKDISDSSRSQNVLPDRINVSDEKLINKYNLSGNNILVTMDGVNLGKTAKFSNDKALLAQRVGRIQSNQLEFIYQVTASPEFLLTMRTLSVGNAIKHISLQQISNYTSFVPNSKAEQQKIGSFFKQLDSTIALHQRKLEKLQ